MTRASRLTWFGSLRTGAGAFGSVPVPPLGLVGSVPCGISPPPVCWPPVPVLPVGALPRQPPSRATPAVIGTRVIIVFLRMVGLAPLVGLLLCVDESGDRLQPGGARIGRDAIVLDLAARVVRRVGRVLVDRALDRVRRHGVVEHADADD